MNACLPWGPVSRARSFSPALAVLLALAWLACADAPAPAAVAAAGLPAAHVASAPAAPLVLAESGWSMSRSFNNFFVWIGNRRNMIQASVVAMALALYIILWRKK